MESTEVNSREIRQPVSKETLNGWLKEGRNQYAFVVYGASSSVLESILRTGILPDSPTDYINRNKLAQGQKYLYYALPFLERVADVDPKLAESIVGNYPKLAQSNIYLPDNEKRIKEALLALTPEWVINSAKRYALSQSLISPFSEIPDIEEYYVLALARDLIPLRQYHAFLKKVGKNIDPQEIDVNKEDSDAVITAIKSKYSDSELRSILSKCLKKRGVLIYLYAESFLKNEASPDLESENAITIVADKPLPASVISGIEILSEADMNDIRKYL